LLDGDARPLRIAHQLLLKFGIPQGSLIHDLQNHDEITFQLVDLGYRTNMKFQLGKEALTGAQLKERILEKMRSKAAGAAAPYNLLYRPEKDGVATTFAGFAAPALGIHDPYHATPEQIAQIRRAHLLFAHANAMQPGVFALSSWDLVGALPIPKEMVAERMKDGDYRWVNRGGVDLMGANPDAKTSAFGLPRAQALYGPLPEQLKQPDSFASQIKRMLAARKRYHIDEGTVIAAPDVADSSIAVLVMRLPDSKTVALTTLNYGRTRASVNLDLSTIRGISASQVQGRKAHDIVADQDAGTVSTDGRLTIDLAPISGRTIVLEGR
jgi:maltose alpha-D-glucosyltransferase/alpha-amylase